MSKYKRTNRVGYMHTLKDKLHPSKKLKNITARVTFTCNEQIKELNNFLDNRECIPYVMLFPCIHDSVDTMLYNFYMGCVDSKPLQYVSISDIPDKEFGVLVCCVETKRDELQVETFINHMKEKDAFEALNIQGVFLTYNSPEYVSLVLLHTMDNPVKYFIISKDFTVLYKNFKAEAINDYFQLPKVTLNLRYKNIRQVIDNVYCNRRA